MLSEWERRSLDGLEERAGADDPGFADRMAGRDPWERWRTAGRWMVLVPVLAAVFALGITACVVKVGSLGMLLLLWAFVGTMVRVGRRTGSA